MTDLQIALPVIAAFVAAYLSAFAVLKIMPLDDALTSRPRLGCIDGLRGYLALAVVAMHFIATYKWKITGAWSTTDNFVGYLGQAGVAVFFMITGYLFVYRLFKTTGRINWRDLYISRVCRIYPLYLLAICFLFFGAGLATHFHLQVSPLQMIVRIAIWLAFGGGDVNLHPNSRLVIAGVHWTLRYEWLFYFLLPLLALALRSRIATGLVIAGILALAAWPQNILLMNTVFLVFFLIGGVAAKLKLDNSRFIRHAAHPAASVAALGAIVAYLAFFSGAYSIGAAGLLAIFFIPVALGNSLFGLLDRKPSILLGEISFSLYLMHGIVLYLLFTVLFPGFAVAHTENLFLWLMPLVTIGIVAVSALTHVFVEKPGIDLGLRLRRRTPG